MERHGERKHIEEGNIKNYFFHFQKKTKKQKVITTNKKVINIPDR